VAVPQDREEIAADAVAAGFDDGQRDRRRQRRVDGVSAALKHRDAGLGGERLRRGDGIPRENRLAPRPIREVPVEIHRWMASAAGRAGGTRLRITAAGRHSS
jgi:hypothetical protein